MVDPDRVVGGEHGDAGAEADPLGPAGDRSQHDVGCGDGVVGAVVLAQPDVVDADPVGEHRLGDDLAQGLGVVAGCTL